jgi:hypothetical protein
VDALILCDKAVFAPNEGGFCKSWPDFDANQQHFQTFTQQQGGYGAD